MGVAREQLPRRHGGDPTALPSTALPSTAPTWGSVGIYEQGLGEDRLLQQQAAVTVAVRDYLARAGAGRRFSGIDVGVRVDPADRSVTVRLRAPLDLPLRIPGSPRTATIGASSTAAVTVQ